MTQKSKDIRAFFKESVPAEESVEIIVSDRFPPFEVRPLNGKEAADIRRRCTKRVKSASGVVSSSVDSNAASEAILTACIVFPPLNDKALLESYGIAPETPNAGAELLQTMLLDGEYTRLMQETMRVSGYEMDMESMVTDAKN